MIRINLLPQKTVSSRQRQRDIILYSVIAVLVLYLFLLLLWGILLLNKGQKERELRLIQADYNKYKKIYAKVLDIEKKKKIITKKINLIKDLAGRREIPVRVLDVVASKLPEGRLYLTSITLEGDEVLLEGVSLDNLTLALYMRQIESSPFFRDAIRVVSEEKKVGSKSVTSFKFRVKVVAYEQAKAATK